jgi:molecular chaperone GrpE
MSAAKEPAARDEAEARTDAERETEAEQQGAEQETADEQASGVSEDLDALLAEAQRERDEYLELAQRAKADFENYRKRAAREASDAERRGRAGIAKQVLPSLDNLERALRAAGVGDPSGDADAAAPHEQPSEEVSAHEALARGVALVFTELRATLERTGIESYDPAGERFDPALHEAISTRPGNGGEAGTVVETLEPGYRLDGQILRPARVIVAE